MFKLLGTVMDVGPRSAIRSESVKRLLNEAVLDANKIEDFTSSPFYKRLEKHAAELLPIAEESEEYLRNVFRVDPMNAVQEEIDHFYFALEQLKSISLKNFSPAEVSAAKAILTTAQRSYNRVLIKLKANDTPEKVLKSFQSCFYIKKTLTLYTDFVCSLPMRNGNPPLGLR